MKKNWKVSGHDFDVHVENYIKSIWNLEQISSDRTGVRNIDLSGQLGVTRASVSNMLDKLERLGLIARDQQRKVKLTPKGRKKALSLIRKHRIVELFLERTLDLEAVELHREAELLEHAVSPELLQRMDEFLGRPETGAQGSAIPRAENTRFSEKTATGESDKKLEIGRLYRVVALSDFDPAAFERLHQLGLKVGKIGKVTRLLDNGFLLDVDGKEKKISGSELRLIALSPVS